MKSIATSPPRKYQIKNQYINTLGTKKYQSLPPKLPKLYPGYKSLRNEAYDYCHDSTDTSRTDKEDSVENLKAMNNKNSDDEYEQENMQHKHSNGSVINKNKEEETWIKRLMSMNFQRKVINYVIDTITSC